MVDDKLWMVQRAFKGGRWMVYGRRSMIDGYKWVVDSRHCMVVGRWSVMGDRRWTVGGVQSKFLMKFDSLSAVELGESSAGRYSSCTNANSTQDHYSIHMHTSYINYRIVIGATMTGF